MKSNERRNAQRQNGNANQLDRREFGHLALAGLAGLAAGRAMGADEKPVLPGLARKKKGDMYYRPFGSTGLTVSELSLGGSPSPPLNIFRAAMERGVNYCDTSPRYSEGKGEEDVGRAIKGRRDQMILGTKFTPRRMGVNDTASMMRQVEESLERLDTDHVDVLCAHRAIEDEDLFSDWVLAGIEKLKKDGKARFFGASVHNSSLEYNRKLIESEHYQVLLIPSNMYFDPRSAEGPDTFAEILRLAAKNGVAVVAMKSLAAGGAAKVPTPDGVSAAQAKLRWVLKKPQVATILNEMTTFDYLKENLAAVTADLSPAEEAWLHDSTRQTADAYCRMCQTCTGVCPEGLPLPELFRARMYAVDYGDRKGALEVAREFNAGRCLARCQGCGQCEKACPWGVDTSRLKKELREIIG